jgi:small basic protein (TIGR04137 family)
MAAARSVMKRAERIKWLIDKGAWTEADGVTGLPKIKVVKLKAIKKEKPKEEEKAAEEGKAAAGNEQNKAAPSKK